LRAAASGPHGAPIEKTAPAGVPERRDPPLHHVERFAQRHTPQLDHALQRHSGIGHREERRPVHCHVRRARLQQLFVAAVGLPFNPGEVLPAILAGDPASVGERLAEVLVDVLGQPEIHQRLTGVVRAAASEPDVARMLRELLSRELFALAAELLGSEDGPFRANLVGSQIVGLVMARYVVQIEPLASMPPKEVAAATAPTLQRCAVARGSCSCSPTASNPQPVLPRYATTRRLRERRERARSGPGAGGSDNAAVASVNRAKQHSALE